MLKYLPLLFILALSLFGSDCLTAQVVYVPVGSSVYTYLDELANAHAIELSTAAKPYSRKLVATKLAAADTSGVRYFSANGTTAREVPLKEGPMTAHT